MFKVKLHSAFHLFQNSASHLCPSCYFSTCNLRSKRFRIYRGVQTNEKKFGVKFINVLLQVIGSGAYGSSPSLFVSSHYHRFLFNCGEGIPRITNAYGIGEDFYKRAFITSCSWPHLSGLIGLMTGNEEVYKLPPVRKVYGPSGLKNIMKNHLVLYDKHEVDPSESCFEIKSENLIFENSLLVKSVPLFPTGLGSPSLKNNLNYVLAYICSFPSTQGIVSTEKLVLASVPPGPLVECLKNGMQITLEDGTVVTPLDVSEYVYNSSTFIVLDIPSVEYLDNLVSSTDFKKYQKNTNEKENDLEVIVHFSPSEVMKDERYRGWVNSFSGSVSHLVINNRSSCLGIYHPFELQLQLNQIHPKIFPLHRNPGVPLVSSETNTSTEEESLNSSVNSEYKFNGHTVQAHTALSYTFRPPEGFQSSTSQAINPDLIVKECLQEESVLDSIKKFNLVCDELDNKRDTKKQELYPNILFLGTGASVGSNYRNDSSILLTLSSENYAMLDCGSKTFTQLLKLMGKDETFSTLRKLKLIFISHKHLDHHSGLIALLTERRKAFLEAGYKTPPLLYVFAPPEIIQLLKGINNSLNLCLKNIHFEDNNNIANLFNRHGKIPKKITSYVQLLDLSIVRVRHCKNACAIGLTLSNGKKIVYSGDCISPSRNLIKLGKNCDLLIHEATFEDGLEDRAEKTRHSTISQAVQVANFMEAKFTILTHFSVRYKKIPLIEDSVFQGNFGIGFDCMKVTFEDLPYLRHIYPILKEMFFEDFDRNVGNKYKRELANLYGIKE